LRFEIAEWGMEKYLVTGGLKNKQRITGAGARGTDIK
jgi:hypothetical protein